MLIKEISFVISDEELEILGGCCSCNGSCGKPSGYNPYPSRPTPVAPSYPDSGYNQPTCASYPYIGY